MSDLTVKKNNSAIQIKEAEALQQMVDIETARREIITKFITDHMKEGADYGRIHISKNCEDKYKCTYEKHPYHYSKPSLFKPGGEKFCSLMKLRPTYKKDIETWEMAGSKPGLFCFLCELVDTKGKVQGEGRGACSTQEKGNENTAIKIATKRAKIDAVLSTGGLSDFFTQDLEDMDLDKSVEPQTYVVQPTRRTTTVVRHEEVKQVIKITEVQKTNILRILADLDRSVEDLNGWTQRAFRKNLDDLTLSEASVTLSRLEKELKGLNVQEGQVVEEVDADEVAKGIEAMKHKEPAASE